MKRTAAVLFLLVTLLALPPKAAGPEAPERPNIVFLLIDTLRADHLGTYGYGRPTSPEIDKLAAVSVVYEKCFSVANWTKPTISSLFTGRFPGSMFPHAPYGKSSHFKIPDNVPTLAETLTAAGYRTVAVVCHPGIRSPLGFDRGFSKFISTGDRDWLKGKTTPREVVLKTVRKALPKRRDRPFFMYIHLIYPHQPYTPPPSYLAMFGEGPTVRNRAQRDKVINAYDGEIRYTDDFVRDLRSLLARTKLQESTVLFLTADHGEEFWEHGHWEHGKDFYNEVIHIPLMISGPAVLLGPPRRESDPVSNIDLFATVTGLAGAANPDGVDSRSLLTADRRPRAGLLYSEQAHSLDIDGGAVVGGRYKYHEYPNLTPRLRLYDLASDPGETRNLLDEDPESSVGGRMREALGRFHQQTGRHRRQPKSVPLDPVAEEGLKSLGYLQ